ncbi:hypothetical protein AB3A53_000205 [Vibrio vulnificus]
MLSVSLVEDFWISWPVVYRVVETVSELCLTAGDIVSIPVSVSRFTLPNDNQQEWTYICDTNVRNVSPDSAKGEVLLSPVSMAILHYQPQESALAKPKV